MVLTRSRILSCGVWLMLMRNTSAPASNRRRIIARSEEPGPRVARILIRRRRLMAYSQTVARGLAEGQVRRGAYHRADYWANPERRHRARQGRACRGHAAARRAARWRR